MTAAAAAAAVTGITDQELTALRAGGWDDDLTDTPGWKRFMKAGDGEWAHQLIFPSFLGWNAGGNAGWTANTDGEEECLNTFDEALARCNERAGGFAFEPGSATKQEDRFTRMAAGG